MPEATWELHGTSWEPQLSRDRDLTLDCNTILSFIFRNMIDSNPPRNLVSAACQSLAHLQQTALQS